MAFPLWPEGRAPAADVPTTAVIRCPGADQPPRPCLPVSLDAQLAGHRFGTHFQRRPAPGALQARSGNPGIRFGSYLWRKPTGPVYPVVRARGRDHCGGEALSCVKCRSFPADSRQARAFLPCVKSNPPWAPVSSRGSASARHDRLSERCSHAMHRCHAAPRGNAIPNGRPIDALRNPQT